MKSHPHFNGRSLAPTAIVIFLLTIFVLLLGKVGDGHASDNETSQIYIPFVQSSSRLAPVPKLIASIPLEGARCPNDMTYNRFSGLLYIANEESNNVSIIKDQSLIGNVPTGKWPIHVEADPDSDRVYLSQVWDDIKLFKGGEITDSIPGYGEPYTITVNPVNGYTYVTDLHRPINIIRGSEKVMNLFVPDFNGQVIGWQLAEDYDQFTGLTYFASWQHEAMTVVDGTKVVDQFSFEGLGASDMVVDSQRGLIVVANNLAFYDSKSPNNLSVVNIGNQEVTSIYSAKYSYRVALDPTTGYVYATNPEDNSVTVLQGTREVATYLSGKKPREVAVDSMTGYAYVTNSEDNSLSVFRDGMPVTTIELPENKGFNPWYVTIDEESGRVFVLNRSSVKRSSSLGTDAVECKRPWLHILE